MSVLLRIVSFLAQGKPDNFPRSYFLINAKFPDYDWIDFKIRKINLNITSNTGFHLEKIKKYSFFFQLTMTSKRTTLLAVGGVAVGLLAARAAYQAIKRYGSQDVLTAQHQVQSWQPVGTVAALCIHPIKSCHRIEVLTFHRFSRLLKLSFDSIIKELIFLNLYKWNWNSQPIYHGLNAYWIELKIKWLYSEKDRYKNDRHLLGR